MSIILNPQRVQTVLASCLFREGEDTADRVEARGVNESFGFHPERLESYRHDVSEMLGELPDEYRSSRGGGNSFRNACLDRHGELWTGEHVVVDQLLVLGIALGEADFCLPRELWDSFPFPGGMPYFMVKQ